jgi:hypothetical protein
MNIGFVATRIAGVDGVSLEIRKLADVLARMGHTSFYCAGELGDWSQPGMLVPEFHFQHPEAIAIHDEAFGGVAESRDLYRRIAQSAAALKDRLYAFADRFQLDWIITQNAQAIPMQIALGVWRCAISSTKRTCHAGALPRFLLARAFWSTGP